MSPILEAVFSENGSPRAEDKNLTGSEANDGTYEVAGRPITHNMTDMVRLANIPRILPPNGSRYETEDERCTALADMHIAQLIFQHNGLATSEDGCQNKCVARQIVMQFLVHVRYFSRCTYVQLYCTYKYVPYKFPPSFLGNTGNLVGFSRSSSSAILASNL